MQPVDSLLILTANTSLSADPSAARPNAGPPAEPYFLADANNALCRGLKRTDESLLSDWNPIVLYGPPASGKSELAEILCRRVQPQKSATSPPRHSTVSISISKLDQRIRHAAIVGGLDELRDHWGSVSTWIVEDYHLFSGSNLVEQTLVRLLDQRRGAGLLTVFCGQKAPGQMAEFSARLQSRLMGGLSLSVESLDVAGRAQILRWAAERLGFGWRPEALRRLSESNLNLRAALDFVQRWSRTATPSQHIELDQVTALLSQPTRSTVSDTRKILAAVARYFRLRVTELTGPSRRQVLVKARGIAICLLREQTSLSWQAIAHATGRQDHSTVLHAFTKTRQSMTQDPVLAEAYRQLQSVLGNSRGGK